MEMPSQQDCAVVIFFLFFSPFFFFLCVSLCEGGGVVKAKRKQVRQSQKKRPVRNLWSPDYKELTDNPVTTEDASANSHLLQNRLTRVLPIIHLVTFVIQNNFLSHCLMFF